MAANAQTILNRHRDTLIKMHLECSKGATPEEALKIARPGDKNNSRALRNWTDLGAWPIPEATLDEWRSQGLLPVPDEKGLPETGSTESESDQEAAATEEGKTCHTETHSTEETVTEELDSLSNTLSGNQPQENLLQPPEQTQRVTDEPAPLEPPDLRDKSTQENTPKNQTDLDEEKPEPAGKTQQVLSVTQAELETMIREIVRQEIGAGSETGSPLELRPVFKRTGAEDKTVARSIRLNKAMVKMAEEKAKQERAKTGGNFNGLVEFLVWEYLGRPSEFVE